ERGGEAAIEPARRVHDEIGPTHDRAPERHHTFVSRLRVDIIGGGHIARAERYFEEPCELPRSLGGHCVLRRAEGRGTRLHVDVRGEAAIHDGYASAHDL